MPRGSFNTGMNTGVGAGVGAGVGMGIVKGTNEQEKIWDVLLNTSKHVVVEAVAGSGKTFVLVQYALREKGVRIGLTAFNKHIAEELKSRVQGQSNVDCMTYHSLGYKTVRNGTRQKAAVDQYKVLDMLEGVSLPASISSKQEKTCRYRIGSMVSYAKTYGHNADVTRDELDRIADRHDVDMNGMTGVVMDYVPKVLKKCMEDLSTIDFDDMVWLPYVLGLEVKKYDVLCVDEYQDTSLTQQWLAVQGGARVCAVGDPRQAIYSFRGCDGKGFEKLRTELKGEVVTLPLSLTRRCPKSHVRLAQRIVPQIHAMDNAPEGVVRMVASVDHAVAEMTPGDLVVCRVNAELVGVAYKLLKRGVKAVVRGRDIGSGMTKLIDAALKRAYGLESAPVGSQLSDVLAQAGAITNEAVAKFLAIPNGRGEMRAANAQDKYECLCELAQECKSVSELRATIEKLFAEFEEDGQPKNAVVLGTVHRTKGLEGNRVYILRPDLIPHPMARREEDVEAEHNLAYVAVTRAKFEGEKQGELVFVGKECVLFPLGDNNVITDVVLEPPQRVEVKSEGKGSNTPTNTPTVAKNEDLGGFSTWDERDLGALFGRKRYGKRYGR